MAGILAENYVSVGNYTFEKVDIPESLNLWETCYCDEGRTLWRACWRGLSGWVNKQSETLGYFCGDLHWYALGPCRFWLFVQFRSEAGLDMDDCCDWEL